MKLPLTFTRARLAGFTVVEVYMAAAIFVMLVIAITAVQLFAARVYTLAATKLTATGAARTAMNYIREQVREGYSVDVGIYTPASNTFTNIATGSPQQGNALVIYSNNPNAFTASGLPTSGIIYFMNPAASNMCSVAIISNAVVPATLVNNVINFITNYVVFDAEDCSNNIMTTYGNNRLIHMKFQFSQWEYPLAGTGSGAMYDFFQLQTRVAPRISNY
jgi:Tfp pilus assembly major pilin PilA